MSTSRYIATCLALVLGVLAPVAGAQPVAPTVGCEACIVVDDSGRVLFERHADVSLPNASTTKMATALVVRGRVGLGEEVVISPVADAVGAAAVDLPRGGGYTVEELLHALLMASSNEAAVALAEHVAGSEPAFVRLLNRRADRAGWNGTAFVTAHGLDRPGHYSTAEDLAAMGADLLRDPVLARIVATTTATIAGDRGSVTFDNRNLLLESYEGAVGLKTGFTALAGNVLVAAAERRGRVVISVAMRSEDAFADSAALLDHGFARLQRTILVRRGQRVAGLLFAEVGSTNAIAARDVRGLFDPARVQVSFVPDANVSLPIASGQAVGVLEVRDRSGDLIASIAATAEHDVSPPHRSLVARAIGGLMSGLADLFGVD